MDWTNIKQHPGAGISFDEILEGKELEGLGEEEMYEINSKGLAIQNMIRSAVRTAVDGGCDPRIAVLTCAQSIGSYLIWAGEKKMASYLVNLIEMAVKSPGGVESILHGELVMMACIRPGEKPPQYVTDRYGEVDTSRPGISLKVEGNVVDASERFTRAGRAKETVH